jgi:hypothetical protein
MFMLSSRAVKMKNAEFFHICPNFPKHLQTTRSVLSNRKVDFLLGVGVGVPILLGKTSYLKYRNDSQWAIFKMLVDPILCIKCHLKR